ncbi:Sulfurtransferase|nr:Sulfurtransferase [Candidatus Pantoea persica]
MRDIAPSPATTVIVNCAGRTRSIIGTQSLVNAGISNSVYALCNGTIGWTLAGLVLEQQQSRRYGAASADAHRHALAQARQVADATGVARIDAATLAR